MFKKFLAVGALALSALSIQAQTLINEGFDSVASLTGSGWVLTNESAPSGTTGWFQGNSGIFGSQSGAPEAYAAANFNSAAAGGTISNWLITPTFSTEVAGTVSFWARAEIAAPFFDTISYGFSTGSSSTGTFALGSASTVAGDWTLYNVSFAAQGAGSVARFAINYNGLADASNYIGIDTLSVTSVPEPSTWVMLSVGLLGVVGARRRARANNA